MMSPWRQNESDESIATKIGSSSISGLEGDKNWRRTVVMGDMAGGAKGSSMTNPWLFTTAGSGN